MPRMRACFRPASGRGHGLRFGPREIGRHAGKTHRLDTARPRAARRRYALCAGLRCLRSLLLHAAACARRTREGSAVGDGRMFAVALRRRRDRRIRLPIRDRSHRLAPPFAGSTTGRRRWPLAAPQARSQSTSRRHALAHHIGLRGCGLRWRCVRRPRPHRGFPQPHQKPARTDRPVEPRLESP